MNQERTQVVGWCGVDKRSDLPGHDCTFPLPDGDSNRWSPHCFFVHNKHRRSGLAKALVAAAEDCVRDTGADILEGYPGPGDSEQIFEIAGPIGLHTHCQVQERVNADYLIVACLKSRSIESNWRVKTQFQRVCDD